VRSTAAVVVVLWSSIHSRVSEGVVPIQAISVTTTEREGPWGAAEATRRGMAARVRAMGMGIVLGQGRGW